MDSTLDRRLSLLEDLLLLALHDDKGRPTMSVAGYRQALAGAILAELLLAERIRIVRPKKKHLVEVADRTPTGDPLLDECLGKIAASKRTRSVASWVGRFTGIKRLMHRVAERLCEKGILRRVDDKVLFVFPLKRYPTDDPGPEQELLDRLRRAVFDEHVSGARTLMAVSLAHATGLLGPALGKKLVRARKAWIKQMVAGDPIGAGTAEALQAAQAAGVVVAAGTR